MKKRKEYTDKIVEELKETFSTQGLEDNVCIIVTGSFGRDEASDESDMDWFVVIDDEKASIENERRTEILDIVTKCVNDKITKNAGDTGTFENIITRTELRTNFGGDKDSNQSFTRRMLYLLESKSLLNDKLYLELKTEILNKYIKQDLSDHALNRFMLNDIIRYYRTICTDYEFKVEEKNKSWGLRKIKLRFSRKLLYFSGLITVASTCSLSHQEKIEKTLEFLGLSPIARIEKILGSNSTEMLNIYNHFLTEISKKEVREALEIVGREKRNESKEYRELKNKAQHFTWEMEKALSLHYPNSHPIHSSLIF